MTSKRFFGLRVIDFSYFTDWFRKFHAIDFKQFPSENAWLTNQVIASINFEIFVAGFRTDFDDAASFEHRLDGGSGGHSGVDAKNSPPPTYSCETYVWHNR